MKRLLPLLFLVPSLALLLYAKRDRANPLPPETVQIRVDSGPFVFSEDVELMIITDSGALAAVRDGVAELTVVGEAPVSLELRCLGAGANRPVAVGQPQKFDPRLRPWTLTVTPDECRAALASPPR